MHTNTSTNTTAQAIISPRALEAIEHLFREPDESSWPPESLIKSLFDLTNDVVTVANQADAFLLSNLGLLGEEFASWRYFSPVTISREKARGVTGGRISHWDILSSGKFTFAAFQMQTRDPWGLCNGLAEEEIPVSIILATGGDAFQILAPIDACSYDEYRVRCDILHRKALSFAVLEPLNITQTTLCRMPNSEGPMLVHFDSDARWNLDEPCVEPNQ